MIFLKECACAEPDILFDSLGVLRLEQVVDIMERRDEEVDSATLILDPQKENMGWEISTVWDSLLIELCHNHYHLLWAVFRVNAVTGEIISVTRKRLKCTYAPGPWH